MTSLWTSGGTTEELATFNWQGKTQCDKGQCILLKTQRSDMTHESGLNRKKYEYSTNWMKCI